MTTNDQLKQQIEELKKDIAQIECGDPTYPEKMKELREKEAQLGEE